MDLALRCAILAEDKTTVENIIIADQSFANSIGAIVCGTIDVTIGDRYENGYFYHDGIKLIPDLTEIEKLRFIVDSLIVDNLNVQNQIDIIIGKKLTDGGDI